MMLTKSLQVCDKLRPELEAAGFKEEPQINHAAFEAALREAMAREKALAEEIQQKLSK